jgi:hypothetical protein
MTEPLRVIPGEKAGLREPRFQLIPFDKLRIGSTSRNLIKGLLPSVGLALIYGPPKCGKSFFAFDMLMHVALDWCYRGRRVAQGAVVYLALEGAEGFNARAEAFRARHLSEDADPVPFYVVATPVNLVADHEALVECIRAQLGDERPVAVAIDTLNRSLPGSESKDEDMAAFVRAADAIRDAFTCLAVIIHHSGIDPRRPRGHTSLTGAADVQIKVERDANDNVIATVEFMKDGPEGAVIVFRLEQVELGQDEDGDPITSCIVVPVDELPVAGKKAERGAKGPRLSAAARTALKALNKALDAEGEAAHASNHIPPNVKIVPIDRWREYAYKAGISDSKEARAKQLAFKRAVEALNGADVIGIWDDQVWIAKPQASA